MAETQDRSLDDRFEDVGPTRANYRVFVGPVPHIEVSGELDYSNAESLAMCLSVFEPGDSVIVDMSRLAFIDSVGIGVLAHARGRGVHITCRGAQAIVRRALEICGLSKILDVQS